MRTTEQKLELRNNFKELKKETQKFYDDYIKLSGNFINLKLYDVFFLSGDKQKIEEKIIEQKPSVNKGYLKKILVGYSDGELRDNFYSFCENEFMFMEDVFKEELGINYYEFVRVGRTSSFYPISSYLNNLGNYYNDCYLINVMENEEDLNDFNFSISFFKKAIEFYDEPLHKTISILLDEIINMNNILEPYLKALEYIEEFKKNQEYNFIEYLYENIIFDDIEELKNELELEYRQKTKKAVNKNYIRKNYKKITKIIY